MRTLSVLAIAVLIGGSAAYLVPMQRPAEEGRHQLDLTLAASSSPPTAARTPVRGESAERLIRGILSSQGSSDMRVAARASGVDEP